MLLYFLQSFLYLLINLLCLFKKKTLDRSLATTQSTQEDIGEGEKKELEISSSRSLGRLLQLITNLIRTHPRKVASEEEIWKRMPILWSSDMWNQLRVSEPDSNGASTKKKKNGRESSMASGRENLTSPTAHTYSPSFSSLCHLPSSTSNTNLNINSDDEKANSSATSFHDRHVHARLQLFSVSLTLLVALCKITSEEKQHTITSTIRVVSPCM